MKDVNITTTFQNPTIQNHDNYFDSVTHTIQAILFGLVFLVGLAGNTLVIYVVVWFSKMRTVTNTYLANLAIADECFLIGIPFLLTTMWYRSWIFGSFACKAYMISTSINQFTSSIFLCIMSIDRYIAVCHPISMSHWRTQRVSRIVSVLAWTVSIILIIPIIKHAGEIEINDKKSCVIHWGAVNDSGNFTDFDMDDSAARIFTYYSFVCTFLIPLFLIALFYTLVVRKLNTVGPNEKSKEKIKRYRKVSNLVTSVVTVYVICWSPYWFTQFTISGSDDGYFITIHLLASCMSYCNSAINPILYAFLSENFKKTFMKAFTCAARKDVNAMLQVENIHIVTINDKAPGRSNQPRFDDIELDARPLVSRQDASTSTISLTTNVLLHETDNVTKVQNNGVSVSTTTDTTMA